MTMFFARGGDNSHLGHTWNAGQALYAPCREHLRPCFIVSRAKVLRHVEELAFVKEGDSDEHYFIISRMSWLLRCFFGFTVNLLLRDFIAYSVPILLMHFHSPLNCVIYSVAINFIVTLDDSDVFKYKAGICLPPFSMADAEFLRGLAPRR